MTKYAFNLLTGLLGCLLIGCSGDRAVPPGVEPEAAVTKEAVVVAYAEHVYASYVACVDTATSMDKAIDAFLAEPTAEHLASAREAWITGRRAYSPTEAFRFYGGPIDNAKDGVEGFLNAWPVDEGYIDYVEGQPKAGIVHDAKKVPVISPDVLQLINEQGGEANVSCGWHAIEFLLWGQDLDAKGPGARPHTDYVVGKTPGSERRREYLQAASELLVRHLTQVRDAWAPDADNYRKTFEAAPVDESLKNILTGPCILFGFELSGERINVAYETGDQEDEHSCFSDTTHFDIADNAKGVFDIYEILAPLARATDAELAGRIAEVELVTRAAISAIPVPFDQCVTAELAQRKPLLDAINALEDHAIAFAALANSFGYTVGIRPE